MKKNQMVHRLKLTDFEIRVAIDALAAYRREQIENNIEHDSTNELLLRLLDLLEELLHRQKYKPTLSHRNGEIRSAFLLILITD